jgi:hypothetical protein
LFYVGKMILCVFWVVEILTLIGWKLVEN